MKEIGRLSGRLTEDRWRQVETILAKSDLTLLTCVFWRMDTPQVIERRTLADSFLYFPLNRRLRCQVGNRQHLVGPGQFLMVAEGIEHEAWQEDGGGDLQVYAVHLNAYTLHAQPLLATFDSPVGQVDPPAAWFEQLELLTCLMERSQQLGRQYGEAWLRSLLLHQLLHGKMLQIPPQVTDQRIWSVVAHILRNYANPLNVKALARRANLSEVQFRAQFRRHTGNSPNAYIQRLRLAKARALLHSDPQLTVKEVAERTGFGSAHYLHALFRKIYGQTPDACRPIAASRARPDDNHGLPAATSTPA